MRESKRWNNEGEQEALQTIFQIYWREELKEAEEALKREGQIPVPAMSGRLRRRNWWMGSGIKKGVRFAGKACAMLFLCMAMVLAVDEDVRAWAWTFMGDFHEEYVDFRTHPSLWGDMESAARHELDYVPEGYSLWRRKHDRWDGRISYISPDKEYLLHFSYCVNREDTYADADNTDIRWKTIRLADGTEAQMGESTPAAGKYRVNYIIWAKDGYLYTVVGVVSTEELQKMVEGVRRIE